jgi:hypothetical protein
MMSDQTDFEIHYQFRGEPRQFCHQALQLCESDALHIATLHAGVWQVGDSIATGPIRMALQQAEGRGVTQVRWKKTPRKEKL